MASYGAWEHVARPLINKREQSVPKLRGSRPFAALIRLHDCFASEFSSAGRMMIRARLERFLVDESGAITADWIALTAAAAGVCVLAVGVISRSTTSASDELATQLREGNTSGFAVMEIAPGGSSGGIGTPTGSVGP